MQVCIGKGGGRCRERRLPGAPRNAQRTHRCTIRGGLGSPGNPFVHCCCCTRRFENSRQRDHPAVHVHRPMQALPRLQEARGFVERVRTRLTDGSTAYRSFMELLRRLGEQQITHELAKQEAELLFATGHADLYGEFVAFFPPGHAPAPPAAAPRGGAARANTARVSGRARATDPRMTADAAQAWASVVAEVAQRRRQIQTQRERHRRDAKTSAQLCQKRVRKCVLSSLGVQRSFMLRAHKLAKAAGAVWRQENVELMAAQAVEAARKRHAEHRVQEHRVQDDADEPSAAKRWREDEDELLLEAHARLENSWTQIARLLPGRSSHGVKKRIAWLLKRGAQVPDAGNAGLGVTGGSRGDSQVIHVQVLHSWPAPTGRAVLPGRSTAVVTARATLVADASPTPSISAKEERRVSEPTMAVVSAVAVQSAGAAKPACASRVWDEDGACDSVGQGDALRQSARWASAARVMRTGGGSGRVVVKRRREGTGPAPAESRGGEMPRGFRVCFVFGSFSSLSARKTAPAWLNWGALHDAQWPQTCREQKRQAISPPRTAPTARKQVRCREPTAPVL